MKSQIEAQRIVDLIWSQGLPRAVFVKNGHVKSMNTAGAHWAGAEHDADRIKYLIGIYDERATVEDIADDIDYGA